MKNDKTDDDADYDDDDEGMSRDSKREKILTKRIIKRKNLLSGIHLEKKEGRFHVDFKYLVPSLANTSL